MKFRYVVLQLFAFLLVASCQNSESGTPVDHNFETEVTLNQSFNTEIPIDHNFDTEVPYIDLEKLWGPSNSTNSKQCQGTIKESLELNKARAELRTMSDGSMNLCLLKKLSASTWEKISEVPLPNYEYSASEDENANDSNDNSGATAQIFDCTDKLFATFDEQPKNFDFLIINLRRVWACHGSAGGTYQQGVITLFIDSHNPKAKTRGLPGLEIANFEEPSGIAYTTQYQFCSGAGFCRSFSLETDEIENSDSYEISIRSVNNDLYIHDPSSKFVITATLDTSMFDSRSFPCLISNLCEN